MTKVYYIDGSVKKTDPKHSTGVARCSFYHNEKLRIFQLGEQTVNFSEYMGLIFALSDALDRRYESIVIKSDSQLLIKQFSGEFQTKNSVLQGLREIVINLKSIFAVFSLSKVSSKENKADLK